MTGASVQDQKHPNVMHSPEQVRGRHGTEKGVNLAPQGGANPILSRSSQATNFHVLPVTQQQQLKVNPERKQIYGHNTTAMPGSSRAQTVQMHDVQQPGLHLTSCSVNSLAENQNCHTRVFDELSLCRGGCI